MLIHQGKCLASSSAKYLQLLLRVNPDVCCGTTDQHGGGQNQGVGRSTQCEPSATLQFQLKKNQEQLLCSLYSTELVIQLHNWRQQVGKGC